MKLDEFINKAKQYGFFYVTRQGNAEEGFSVSCTNEKYNTIFWASETRDGEGIIDPYFNSLIAETAAVQKVVNEVRS